MGSSTRIGSSSLPIRSTRSCRRPQGGAGQFRGGGGGHGPTGAEEPAHQRRPASGRGRRRAKHSGRGLRAVAAPPRPPCRPGPADGRGSRTPAPLSERPKHAGDASGVWRRADHQRKRHRGGRGVANHLRRQRPAGGHRNEPDPGSAAGAAFRRGGAFRRRSPTARQPADFYGRSAGCIGLGPGLRPAGRAEQGRHGQQAGSRPAGNHRRRKRDYRLRPRARCPVADSRRQSR